MLHAITHLENELRQLLETWRALTINFQTPDLINAQMERQTEREIKQTASALHALRLQGGGTSHLSDVDRHLLYTITRDRRDT